MATSNLIFKRKQVIVLGFIGIAIILFHAGLNSDVYYLWDINVIPIRDDGKTVNVVINQDASNTDCVENESCYSLNTIWFNPGGSVTFHNEDTVSHTITSAPLNDDYECVPPFEPDGVFDSGPIAPGESWTFTPSQELVTNEDGKPIWTDFCYYDKLYPHLQGLFTVKPGYDVATLIYMSGSVITAIVSFHVSRSYRGSDMFPKAYLFLGLAFCCWFIGDMFFFYNDYVEDLPSLDTPYITIHDPRDDSMKNDFSMEIADFVYIGIYPFMALHLYLNANYFQPKKSKGVKFAIFGVPLVGAIIFFIQFGAITWESVFGSLNAVGASVTLGLVVYGAKVFNNSTLKPAWFLLLIGIFISTIGDFLYYQVEDFNNVYAIYSTSTTMYVLAYMTMIYGLFRHTQILSAK